MALYYGVRRHKGFVVMTRIVRERPVGALVVAITQGTNVAYVYVFSSRLWPQFLDIRGWRFRAGRVGRGRRAIFCLSLETSDQPASAEPDHGPGGRRSPPSRGGRA